MTKTNAILIAAAFLAAPLACGPLPAVETTPPLNSAANTGPGASSGSASSSGSSTNHGSGSNSTSGVPAGIFPTIPNHGGALIASPKLVVVTFNGDPNHATLEDDAAWVATGGYLETVGGEYGIGNGTILANVRSDAAVPALTDVQTFILAGIADGTLPAYGPTNIYVITIPASSAAIPDYCAHDLGFHSYFADTANRTVLYAVVPDCGGDVTQMEVTLAHEVVEAATDPALNTYQIQDPTNPWSLLDGEVADLCASVSVYVHDPSGRFSAPLVWSNAAASASQIPCVPWPGTSPYLTVVPSSTTAQKTKPGDSFSVSLTGWASAPNAGDCKLVVAGQTIGDFAASPTLSAASVPEGGQVTVTLSVPSDAKKGQRGGAWIGCIDASTGQVLGSTVLAVEAADQNGQD